MSALSPLDYYFYRPRLYAIQFAFEYDGLLDLNLLRRSLDETARLIPALTSRISEKSDLELELAPTNEKIPLRIQLSESRLESDLRGRADELFDSVTTKPGEPLVKVLVTETPTKSHVGFSFSHLLADGFGFIAFLKTLSALATQQKPPVLSFDRTAFHPLDQAPRKVTTERLFEDTGYTIPRPPSPPKKVLDILRIPSSDLQALKEEAATLNSAVTTNDALMAFLLKRYYQEIPLSVTGELIVRCPVDFRKTCSIFPENYFGNAVKDAVIRFKPDQFHRLSLAEVATKVRTVISSIQGEVVSKALICLRDLRLQAGHAVFADVGCPGLLVTNLTKFPLNDVDLGRGKPVNIHHASLNPRLAVLLAAENGIEIKYCRPAPVH